ncbi:MAG TPA: threonine synthase [Stellaceae bacterium]|jgi:threonine synthase|nr:threonine synthase [Stellaceae bacterium]
MRYLSTRAAGPAPATRAFEDVLLAGLAEDGGLFVPDSLPKLDAAALCGLAGLPYAELAARMMALFVGDSFSAAELRQLTDSAYRGFNHAAVAPLVQIDERLWLLELFHGPTLAFKDLALQLVGLMFDAVLARRAEHVTIVGATSGDTGSAAMAACRDRAALDIFMLYPHGRISEVQRRQMTTADAANAHALAIEGTFDDCQDIVKTLFADPALRGELNLSAVNSINFARVAAQIVYYVFAGLALGAGAGRKVAFSVPTGNFGNVYAGHLARALGLPVSRLVIGTNANDILARYLTRGEMAIAPVTASLSPSMDIQVASNFERLLFELKGRNGAAVASALGAFRQTGALPADEQAWRQAQRLFSAHRVDDSLTLATIADVHARSGMLIDPHTAVAIAAARAEIEGMNIDDESRTTPMIALASAHPAKFPDAVARATGIRPAMPPALADIMERRERVTVLPNEVGAIARYVRAHARRKARAA